MPTKKPCQTVTRSNRYWQANCRLFATPSPTATSPTTCHLQWLRCRRPADVATDAVILSLRQMKITRSMISPSSSCVTSSPVTRFINLSIWMEMKQNKAEISARRRKVVEEEGKRNQSLSCLIPVPERNELKHFSRLCVTSSWTCSGTIRPARRPGLAWPRRRPTSPRPRRRPLPFRRPRRRNRHFR